MSTITGVLCLTYEEAHVLYTLYEEVEPAPINPSFDDADSYCNIMRMTVDEWANYVADKKAAMYNDNEDSELLFASRPDRVRIIMQRRFNAEKQARDDKQARLKASDDTFKAEMESHPQNCKCLYHDHPF